MLTWTVILAGSGTCPSMSPTLSPHGMASEIGSTLSLSMRSMPSSLDSHSPRLRNRAVSWPPTETTGTIGTSFSSASRMKPLRPPKSTFERSQLGRCTS